LNPVIILLLAAWLDYLLGDPWGWPHPVRVLGWVIHQYTQGALYLVKIPCFRAATVSRVFLRCAGVFLALGLIGGSGAIAWGLLYVCRQLHPLLELALAVVLLASCFAGRSLHQAAVDVLDPLEQGDLEQARSRLSQYVGRDTAHLSQPEVLRAVLETVSENATYGVLAPLFYALVGLALPAIGSAPLALAYKAASTLDSMIGYRTEPFRDLGWLSARLEDGLTWLPCRLLVLTLALRSGRPCQVWRLCQRDAVQDPSPNSGWSECAYAAVLGVQLGGLNVYQGVIKPKPLLGDPLHPITPDHIRQALQLTRWSFLGWLGLVILGAWGHQGWVLPLFYSR
jgi:adenosylcobinamide-phosphate synthase